MSKPIRLQPHPDSLIRMPTPLVWVGRTGEVLRITFRIPGDTSTVELPAPIDPYTKQSMARRADRLWENTCFECFVRPDGETGYLEFNFSPSMEWAAYSFEGYRDGMKDADLPVPAVIATPRPSRFELSARVELPGWGERSWLLNIAAIIREKDSNKSYWALAHPPGAPDFHHPDCFVLQLPPTGTHENRPRPPARRP